MAPPEAFHASSEMPNAELHSPQKRTNTLNMARTYNLWTIGCQMNEADSRHLGSQLEALGYVHTEEAKEADLVVLNTCVVRESAENKAHNRLHKVKVMKRNKPDMTIGLMGCMVGMREQTRLAKKFPWVDVFMPPSDPAPLMEYIQEHELHDLGEVVATQEKAVLNAIQDGEHILPALQRGNRVVAHVPIVLGCSHACTFCIIPYRRGAERSRPQEEILREVAMLARQGVREVMLLGQIVDRYGNDLEEDIDLADLLVNVAGIEQIHRVRFLTSHPNWMSDRIIDAVANHPKLMPHFEVPVQAGNDKVLADMRRGHEVQAYRELIARIRERVPGACINTDIIVGFPGETEAEFQDTYDLLAELRLDKIHLARYSERPKTIAARSMPDDVSKEAKEDRRKRVHALNESILEDINQRWLDQKVEVLFEGQSKGNWRGRTPHNRLVFVQDERDLTGAIATVHISAVSAYSLNGTVREILVDPLPPEQRRALQDPRKRISADELFSLNK